MPKALLIFLAGGGLYAQEAIDVEARVKEITEEDSPALFSMSILNSDVALLMSGYWKGTLTGSWGLAKTAAGWGVASVDSPVLFMQEADLSFSLWMRERWFVEASFQEDYDVNTYRAGYRGKAGDFVRYAGVGNTGLDFPVFPYLDLGGDSASSFGFYGAFGAGALTFHSLIRYDDAVREERVFSGGRERTYSYLAVSNMLRGVSFVLPSESLSAEPLVYLEDPEGTLQSNAGGTIRRWRLARPSEFAVSARYGIVELSASPAGMVAVSYPSASYNADMGTYADGSSFLGQVQAFFSGAALASFPQPGGGSGAPASLSINGVQALVVYEKGAFSPFERQSRYSAPASNSVSAALVSASTKDILRGFDVYELADSANFNLPLYVREELNPLIYARSIYQVSRSGTADLRAPASRWPLAKDAEGNDWLVAVYLSGKESWTSEAELRWTNYGADSGYLIGKDVIPGSIEVLRSGIIDPNWNFDAGSGTVRLSSPALTNEIIRINYLRRSLDRRNGSLAIGLGAVYEGEGHFSTRTGVGLRWNVSSEGYSEENITSPGLVGFGSKFAWDYDSFKAALTIGGGYEQPDTLGLYRVAGMEGNETLLILPDQPASFISNAPANTALVGALTLNTRSNLVYRNYVETNFAGITALREIEWDAPLVPSINAPYPARDNAQGTRVLAAEFALDGAGKTWAGFESPLPDGNALSTAHDIIVPFRLYGAAGASDAAALTLVLQFGPLSAKDSYTSENPLMIVERQAAITTAAGLNSFNFVLNDDDRRKLQGATHVRLLAISRNGGAFSGRVLLAPPIVRGAKFAPLVAGAGGIAEEPAVSPVSTAEVYDASLAREFPDTLKRLHPDGEAQRVLQVSWDAGAPLNAGTAAGAGGRVGRLPLTEYKQISFFIKFPAQTPPLDSNSTLDFYVARGKSSFGKPAETALEAHIPLNVFAAGAAWTKVELRYSTADRAVYAGSQRVADLSYRSGALRKNSAHINESEEDDSAFIMIFISPPAGSALPAASFLLDEILLEEGDPSLYLNAGATLSWRRTGTLVELVGVPIIENTSFESAAESAVQGTYESQGKDVFFGVVQRSRAELLLLGARLSGNFAFSVRRDDFSTLSWWSAEHGISRAFGPFSFHEDFFFDPMAAQWKHSAGASVSGAYHARYEGEVSFENEKENRAWQAGLGAKSIAGSPLGVSLDADWRWITNKPLGAANSAYIEEVINENYGEVWLESWKSWAPDAGSGAERRTMHGKYEMRLDTKPVGGILTADFNTEASLPALRSASGGKFSLDFPFSVGNYSGNFRIERHYERSLLQIGADALDDFSLFAETFTHAGKPLAAIPLYALFDPELSSNFSSALRSAPRAESTEGGSTGDIYRFSMQFPAHYGIRALFLPRSLDAHIDRKLTMHYDTLQDVLGTGGELGFSAVDLFGALGARKIVNFYQKDEFHHSIQAAIAIPQNDNTSYRVSMQHGVIFFGFTGAELHFDDIISILSSGWTANFALEWVVPTEKSLLGSLYAWLMAKFQDSPRSPALASLANSPFERIRKEKLELSFDYSNAYPYFILSAGHESIIRIAKRFELRVFAKLSYSQHSDLETESFIASIGTSLNVHF